MATQMLRKLKLFAPIALSLLVISLASCSGSDESGGPLVSPNPIDASSSSSSSSSCHHRVAVHRPVAARRQVVVHRPVAARRQVAVRRRVAAHHPLAAVQAVVLEQCVMWVSMIYVMTFWETN